jgi:hypothetical protein
MKKHIIAGTAAAVFVLLVSMLPSRAHAASVYLESSRDTISVGDTAIITVKVNADGAILNTIDGNISLTNSPGSLTIKEFSLANSSFGLWPRTPSLSEAGHDVAFVGGVPGGFSIEGATLFNIIVEGKTAGAVTISPKDISAFANDGKGTKVSAALQGVTVTVVPKKAGEAVQNDWMAIVSGDTTPPSDFIIVFGQDESLFSGKKFAFFSAVDNQSGIDHYEVSENGAPAVRSGSTYVLQDQDGETSLSVIAYDKAGNKKSAARQDEQGTRSYRSVAIIGALVFILGILGAFMAGKKRRKNSDLSNI